VQEDASAFRSRASGADGEVPCGQALGLEPGELVEIKSRDEIETTLTAEGENRGLFFELEMLRYCGRRYRASFHLRKIISEQTGKMVHLNDTVVLDGVTCKETCSANRPREDHFYWREIWLRRA
jgi:hypothetical protein